MNRRLLITTFAVLALVIAACAPEEDAAEPEATPAPTPDETDVELGEEDDAALERLRTAVANTRDEGTARFVIGLGDEALDTRDTGTTGTSTHAGPQVEGEVDFETGQRALHFQDTQADVTAIVDGDDVYVQLPTALEGQWARVSLDQIAGQDATQGPAGLLLQDPDATLDFLEDAAVEAREVGPADDAVTDDATPTPTPDTDNGVTDDATPTPDTDNGVTDDATPTPTPDTDNGVTDNATPTPTPDTDDTTTTAAEPDLVVVLDVTQIDDAHPQLLTAAEQAGTEEIEAEVWIDDQERIEQVRYSMAATGTGAEPDATPTPTPTPDADDGVTDDASPTPTPDTDNGVTDDASPTPTPDTDNGVTEDAAAGDLAVTIRYMDFGTPVEIEVPEDDQVVELEDADLAEVFDELQGLGGGTGTDR